MSSGWKPATVARTDLGVATVDNPAPARSTAIPAIATDPALPRDPPSTRTCPKLPLFESGGRGPISGAMSWAVIRLRCNKKLCFVRRTNGRNHNGPAGQLSENLRRMRSREGHDGIRTSYGSGLLAHDVGHRSRGNVHGDYRRRSSHSSPRCRPVKFVDRRPKPSSENRIDQDIGTEHPRTLSLFNSLPDLTITGLMASFLNIFAASPRNSAGSGE